MNKIQYLFTLLLIAAIGLSACNKRTKELESQVAKLEQMLTAAQSELSSLRTEKSAQSDFEALETKLSKLTSELETLKTSQHEPVDISELEQQISDLSTEISTLKDTQQEHVSRINIEAQINALLTEIEILKANQYEPVSLTDVETKLSELEAAITTLNDITISGINNEIEKLRTDLLAEINALRTAIESLPLTEQSALDQLLDRIDALETALEKYHPATRGFLGEYEWVDLGLSSGILWAACNVGATTQEAYGNYYAWGETTQKEFYTQDTYEFTEDPETLEPEQDVAQTEWQDDWRMPTADEFDELFKTCTSEWTIINEVPGRLFTSSTTGESIFLPAAGRRVDTDTEQNTVNEGLKGYYWASTIAADVANAYCPNFSETSKPTKGGGYYRYNGQPVRPVRNKPVK